MPPAILVIDDSAVAREMILDALRKADLQAELHAARNGIEALEQLRQRLVDVIICDLEMPGIDGLGFLDRVKVSDTLRDIPVIILTGHETQAEKICGLERGACDYVTKPFDPGELVARVKVQLKIKSLQDKLRESNRRLEQLSRTDPLTGLANRRRFMMVLQHAFEYSRRNAAPLAMVMLDIDHFKKINDTYGHQGGDEVLIAVANLLRPEPGDDILAARYGGEEFALVLPEATLEIARRGAERLRQQIESLSFTGPLADLRMTASFGVAALPHPAIATMDQLIREADDALYRAKHNGRNRVEVCLS
ncbi:MAG: diguanylate cyclase [Desulfuromonadales bacterium]|nr:diguanylate cyclase [Desulfuromonadales bacterium]